MGKMTGRHKMIGGEKFWRYRVGLTEAAAKSLGKELRKTGRYYVRVQMHEGKYAVYCRER